MFKGLFERVDSICSSVAFDIFWRAFVWHVLCTECSYSCDYLRDIKANVSLFWPDGAYDIRSGTRAMLNTKFLKWRNYEVNLMSSVLKFPFWHNYFYKPCIFWRWSLSLCWFICFANNGLKKKPRHKFQGTEIYYVLSDILFFDFRTLT